MLFELKSGLKLTQQDYRKRGFMFGLSLPMILLFVVIIAFVIWFYSLYVALIRKKNAVKEAFASIDVQLKKRYDLIPNVLFMANKFMEHERSLIEDITKLRTEAVKLTSGFNNISDKIKLDGEIQNKMGQLLVSVENYPQLKSDNTMVQAMQTYNEVEEHIAAARRFYNSAVNELNNAVEIWPGSMIAASLNIKGNLPYFEITKPEERESVSASQFFDK